MQVYTTITKNAIARREKDDEKEQEHKQEVGDLLCDITFADDSGGVGRSFAF
jgi:hypothetical protein